MSERRWTVVGVALLVVGFGGLVFLDARNGTLRANVVPTTVVWFLVAFAGYLLVIGSQQRDYNGSRSVEPTLRWLLLFGLALRLVLVATEPTLSDDVYRYLWEGHLVTEGVSPYAFTIDDPAGDVYDIAARGLANNTTLASPYLPVAHGIFGAASAVLPSEPWTMQLLMIAFDSLALGAMLRLLALAKLPRSHSLLYWLNPLVVVEVAHGAHIDAVIVGLALAGLALTLDRRYTSPLAVYGGPLLIAAATLTRPLAVLLMPVLFWLWTWRQRLTWVFAVVVPTAVVGVISGFGVGADSQGTGVFGSARAYADNFRFNSGLYYWVEAWIGRQGLDDKGWNEPGALARLVIAGVVVAILVGVFGEARRRRDTRQTMRLLAVPVGAYVIFTPVLHPWYILLLLVFVPFLAPGTDEAQGYWIVIAPWVALSALLIFSYLTYENPSAFAERPWVRKLEWYPTLSLLTVAGLYTLTKRVQARPSRGAPT